METIDYKGYLIKIEPDTLDESPRKWDNLGTMICFHKRYCLGDENHGYKHEDYNGWGELEKQIKEDHGECVILPIYMYDHSGITVSTSPFSCPWDSGRLGLIFMSKTTF